MKKAGIIIALFSAAVIAWLLIDDQASNPPQGVVASGQQLFDSHCATCHGKAGQGLATDWRQRLPDGSFPPPPLNGTAHTWHHSPAVLLRTIDEGGVALGGKMPGFKHKLSGLEKQAILDYIYSLWPKELKQKYDQHFQVPKG